jgi:uncharacterized membrane protein
MNKRVLAIALLAFIGMLDTFYISAKRGGPPVPCHVTKGCNDVLTSKYSQIGRIPLSWIGLAFYLAVFSCAVFQLSGTAELIHLIYWPAMLGLLISLSLTSLQAFVIHAYCEFCLLSALLVSSIFVLSFFERRSYLAETGEPAPSQTASS